MGETSILDRSPLEEGGRSARRGFAFQDHIAARFCLTALADGAPHEIRVEQHDDITLVWRGDGGTTVEFVQVKAHTRAARWSAAAITAPDSRGGLSLLEKSLRQARGPEPSLFRIVTTTDADDDLALLKLPRGHPDRESAKFIALADELERRLPAVTTENGTSVRDWARLCLWEKPADSVDSLHALNIRRLEQILTTRGVIIAYTQRDEIYDALLSKIAAASAATADTVAPFTPESLSAWLESAIAAADLVVWSKADVDAIIDRCRKATELEIQTRVGRKYISELYVEREIDRTCAAFISGTERAFILVEKAGSGKTNLLCNLALRHAAGQPVLFLSGRLALSPGGLVAEIQERLGTPIDAVFRELGRASTSLLVVLDGINENNDPHAMRDALIRLLQFGDGEPLKLIVSCRDLFWPAFDGEHWGSGTVRAGARVKVRSHTLHDFTAAEFEQAHQRYFRYFGVKAELRGEARLKCRHPLLLRFFCEAYGTPEGEQTAAAPAFDDIRLKTLFDVYWSRKLERIREFSDDPMVKGTVTDVLFAMADFLLTHHRKDISRQELYAAGGALAVSLSPVLSRICDEDIIVAQDGDLGVTSFVYDEFMEYTMARMLFERRRWKQLPAREATREITALLDEKREYSHVQNVAQYLLLWIEDEHPDIHDEVVLALAGSGRSVYRRVVASAVPKFRHVSAKNLQALEISASEGDEIERGEVAFAVARLFRDGAERGPFARLFFALAKQSSPFVAISLLGGLETASVLSPNTIRFVMRWSEHREPRVRLACAAFLASDPARVQPELRTALDVLTTDVDDAVQDAALLSARTVLGGQPESFVTVLRGASSPGGIAAGVAWLIQESGFAHRVDREELAAELARRHDSTLDKAALQLARTLENPARRAAIAEDVCQHMDYRSFHEAAKLAFAYGERERYLQRYTALARELTSAGVFSRGALRKTQGSLRRRRASIEKIFETADWVFLFDVDPDATLAICRELFAPHGISEHRTPTFLSNLQPLIETAGFMTHPAAPAVIVEAVRQGVARGAGELIAWADARVHVAEKWSAAHLAGLLDALLPVRGRAVGYAGVLCFLAGVQDEAYLMEMSRRLLHTGLTGVCVATMCLLSSARRGEATVQSIMPEARRWPMATCRAVAQTVHIHDASAPLIDGLGAQWTQKALFEPLMELASRLENEMPSRLRAWFTILQANGLFERAPDDQACARTYGQKFASDDVHAAAIRVIHTNWVMLCARAAGVLSLRGAADIARLAKVEMEGGSWQFL